MMTTATSTRTSTAPSNIESRLAALEVTLGLSSLTVAGGEGGGDASDAPQPADLSARIDRIVSDLNSTVRERQAAAANEAASSGGARSSASASVSVLEDFAEIDRLMSELDAGAVLSHQGTAGLASGQAAAQQPLTAPLLYRRQEVLASAESLKVGMERLGEMRSLLDSVATSSASAAAQVAAARGGSGTSGAAAAAAAKSRGSSERGKPSAANFVNSSLITSDRYEYAADADSTRRLQDVSVQAADINARAVSVATRLDNLISQYHRVMTLLSEKCVLVDEELSGLEMREEVEGE